MTSNTAFEHTKEMVGSMTFAQAKSLQIALNARLDHFLVASKAFGITELLAKILEHLDFFGIFTVMRVNRAFRDTVLGSIPLHRKIFTLPSEAPAADALISVFDRKTTVNPHIQGVVFDIGFTLSGCFCRDAANFDCYHNAPAVDPVLELRFTISPKRMNKRAPVNDQHYQSETDRDPAGTKNSWALTRINAFPIRVRVGFVLADGVSSEYFCACHEFRAESATLDALYDLSIVALERLADKQIVSSQSPAEGYDS